MRRHTDARPAAARTSSAAGRGGLSAQARRRMAPSSSLGSVVKGTCAAGSAHAWREDVELEQVHEAVQPGREHPKST